MPENTMKVDRSTPLGNPFRVGVDGTQERCVELHRALMAGLLCMTTKATVEEQQAHRRAVMAALPRMRGMNLGCWCRIGTPCHADTLLDVANRKEVECA